LIRGERKPRTNAGEDVNVSEIASNYLKVLEQEGLRHVPVAPVKAKSSAGLIAIEHQESAAEYLEKMTLELSVIHKVPDVEERFEVEEQMVILFLGKTRVFNGFLSGRPVFGFQPQLALEMTEEQALKVQQELDILGFSTERRLSLSQKESAF
jgi:hypothetical protein